MKEREREREIERKREKGGKNRRKTLLRVDDGSLPKGDPIS